MTLHVTDPYAAIVQDLAYSYDGVFSRESVAAAVETARRVLEPVSTVTTYLPILVAKQAKQRKVRYALSNSFGFGGTNASLIFGAV